jgi:hypothetical protein
MSEQPNAEDFLAKLVELSEEQLRWQRAAVLPTVRETVRSTLSTEQQRKAFEMCDGTVASSDVATAVKTSKQNLSGWTRRWRDVGIAYEVSGRRIRHLASLNSLGIPLKPEER